MTMYNLFDNGIITDSMEIIIRNHDFKVLAKGKWFKDNVLLYMEAQIESFIWHEKEKIVVKLKKN